MMRFGLIGCGRIGQMHARTIMAHSDCRLAMVHDIAAESARNLGEATGAAICRQPDEIFSSDLVDAVLVASSTPTHADYIVAAVEAGKAVLCEKPIDLDLARVRACRGRIAGREALVQIGFNRRFDPGHAALKSAMDRGEIGDTLQILITSRDPRPPSPEYVATAGGMLRDMTIHDFDLARFLLAGDEIAEVFAYAGALIDPAIAGNGDEDCAMVLMRTAAGKQVLINNSRQAVYGYDQRIEVLGSAGMLQSANRRAHELRRFSATLTDGAEPYLDFFIERYQEAFVRQLDGFVRAVRQESGVAVTFDDGLEALRLAQAAYASLEAGRSIRVIDI